MEERPNYYAIIPAEVRYDNDLRPNEKLLYGEISCLTESTGECWATNKYFSQLYNVQTNAIATWIRHLKDKQYIEVEYIYSGKEIQKRIIKLGGIQKDNTYSQKDSRGIHKKIGGYSQKGEENNTSMNTTSKNITRYYKDDELNDMFLEYLTLRKKIKAVNSERAINCLLKKLEPYQDSIKKEMIEESIVNSWKSVYPLKEEKQTAKERHDSQLEVLEGLYNGTIKID
jgi:hypothetical protein